jgi:NADH:ubiquinone oxidoreductase subunit 2 (subunit N)
MTPELSFSLALATPELMLAIGAMVMLMVGVFSGERSTTLVNGLSVAILIAAGAGCCSSARTVSASTASSSAIPSPAS